MLRCFELTLNANTVVHYRVGSRSFVVLFDLQRLADRALEAVSRRFPERLAPMRDELVAHALIDSQTFDAFDRPGVFRLKRFVRRPHRI